VCYVYHYTTAEGFKSIIESQELWATSIYHLTDWTEFDHGRDAFIESAKALLKSEEVADAATQMLSYLHDAHPPLFVCSFSTGQDGDDLTQWRAYAPKGGYAIGFPIADLHTYAGILRFDLLQCEYGTAGTQVAAEGIVKIIGEILKMAGGIKGFRSQFPFKDPSKDGLLALLLNFIVRYKHNAFSAENEWRLVHRLEPGEQEGFRMSSNDLVPYVAFSLKNDKPWKNTQIEKLWKKVQIVVSPCSPDAGELRRESVRAFLESELRKHNLPTDCGKSVRLSRAPYRTVLGA
jgi:hypothetical protein